MLNLLRKIKLYISYSSLGDKVALFSMTGTLISIIYYLATGTYKIEFPPLTKNSIEILENKTEKFDRDLKLIKKSQADLTKAFKEISNLQSNPEVNNKLNIFTIKKSIDSLGISLKRIESIIIQDPSKALELPLMKKDFENLKERNITELDRLRLDIDKTNTFMLTTLVVLALGVLTNTLINIGKRDNSKKDLEAKD